MLISILVSCWSAILIFALMVRSKYSWTRAPFRLMIAFGLAGVLSTLPALAVNTYLGEFTDLQFLSPDPVKSSLGFMIGAGFGEELWKMLAGLVVLVLLVRPVPVYACVVLIVLSLAMLHGKAVGWDPHLMLQAQRELLPLVGVVAIMAVLVRGKLQDADIVLGFVTVGLGFAAIENLYSYSDLPVDVLLVRGCMAVPLHGAMGLCQGLAVVSARRRKAAWPLFFGYLFVVAGHTGWDLVAVMPAPFQEWILIPVCILMILLCARAWLRVPEVAVDDLAFQHGEEQGVPI